MPTVTRKSGPHNQDTCPLALSWMFKLVIDCGGHRDFINHGCFSDDDVARELGIYWLVDAAESDEDDSPFPGVLPGRARRSNVARKSSFQERSLAALRNERKLFDKAFPKPELPDNLRANLANLAQLIGLDEVEQKLIGFCSLMNTDTLLDDCCNQLGYIGFNRLVRVLSTLLDIPQSDLRLRLSAEGRLVQSGLIEANLRSGVRNHMSDLLGFNNKDLLFSVRHHQGSAIGLFQSAFRPAPESMLEAKDFIHLDTPLNITRPYLQQALDAKKAGVNILIYGPPGTGKSQLTRLLASELQAELFEIACTDNSGDPIDRRGRLCALRSAMCVLNQQKTLLVLDEIEDLFSGSNELAMFMGSQERQKGWINRMLEENPIPCFWLTNNIRALDNAYIRRFDLVLKLENPPRLLREGIIRSASNNRLPQSLVEKLADHEQLMPAIITRAMDVANSQAHNASAALETTVEFLVNATLQAQGFARLGQNRMQALPEFYSPDLANTDMPLDQLLTGLRNHGEARLCFYGPPGTGKTAFGHWLAIQLGKPLLTRRASDLISPYIGMTEQNFARAFEQATDDDAVLLLDEVDSFLQDRRKARHSWEVSAVNEMLTQMESYRGLFIASTNLMENLDEASLRRFDLKINFDYLGAEQITNLLRRYLRQMGLKKPDSLKLARLLRQSCLTPGDFALVARRARFQPFTNADQVVDALLAESSLKTATTMRAIGFAEW